MPNKCFVPGCTTGYASCSEKGISTFHPPKDKLEAWSKAIPRAHATLKSTDVVCEKHFDSREVLSTFSFKMPDGTIIEEKRKKKELVPGAVPHIFPNLPKYLTSRKACRKSPKKRYSGSGTRATPESVPVIDLQKNSLLERLKIKVFPTPLNEAVEDLQKINLPEKWQYLVDSQNITFVHSPSGNIFNIDKTIRFSKALIKPLSPQKPIIHVNNSEVSYSTDIATKEDLEKCILYVHKLKLCPGSGTDGGKHSLCLQTIQSRFSSTLRCKFCQRERKRILRNKKRLREGILKKQKKIKARREQGYRMKKKIVSMRKEIASLQQKMSNMENDAIEKVLSSIDEPKHKEVVKAIIMASKYTNTKSRRYSNDWMYECILMRIKSPALYRKMLRDNLLPLPSLRTIQRFLCKLKPQFGFHEGTFKLMGQKAQHLSEQERHGVLMADEMATEQNIEFNKSTGQVFGMVDMGSASPPNADSTLGDHGLVFLFQPFKGQWFQAIGAFCTKGAAKGPELEKLVTEAIILLYKYGYYVDVVTTDGGSWNRNMWTLFGIDETNVSSINPATTDEEVDESRRLWFMSDFPHLVKSMWSRVRTKDKLQTPDGEVKLEHWGILTERDSETFTHINVCHKLTPEHVNPTNWQTMNVKMAFQFFHEDVADAMEYYRDYEEVPELQDCQATIKLIRKVAKLRKAMNARHCWDSLKPEEDNEGKMAIIEFIEFLDIWRRAVPESGLRLAWQTELGLKVTLKGTLELSEYLKQFGFDYLMTRRLNQDPLEHFFGRIRQACGANQHPDPMQFIQVYRLLSTASLIKPPRGSNVSGGDMLKSLTSLDDILNEQNLERKEKYEEEIDRILDEGDQNNVLDNLFSQSADGYLESVGQITSSEHSYNVNTKINPFAFQMFGGYVARRVRKFSTSKNCSSCFDSLCKSQNESDVETQSLIDKRSRGFLLKPSTQLYNFLIKVENVILNVLGKTQMNRHILLAVIDELQDANLQSEVGCEIHKRELTKQILMWFINTRLIFACKRHIKTQTAIRKKRTKAKSLMKKIKLNAIGEATTDAPQHEKAPAKQTKMPQKARTPKAVAAPKARPDKRKLPVIQPQPNNPAIQATRSRRAPVKRTKLDYQYY